MSDDSEVIRLEVDPEGAIAGAKAANSAMDSYGKTAESGARRASRAFEEHGSVVVRIADRSRSSVERLISSLEKQAQTYGKTGVEKMIADRDQLLKRYANEETAVTRITAAYQKMIEVQRTLDASGGGGESGGSSGFRLNYALRGVKDVFEGRGTFAVAEASNTLLALRGTALVIGGITAGLGAAALGAYELHKHFEEIRLSGEKLHGVFGRFVDEGKLANAEMRVTNDHLANAIAKLEHRPENNLKLAIDEAAVAADHLAEKMDKGLRGFADLAKANAPGVFSRFLLGQAGTKDIQELVGGKTGFGGIIGDVYKANTTGGDIAGVLSGYRAKVTGMLDEAEHPAGTAGPMGRYLFGNPGADPERQKYRIETLRALLSELNTLSTSYGLEKENISLTDRKNRLENDPNRIASDRERQEFFSAFEEVLKRRAEEAKKATEKMMGGATTLSIMRNPALSPDSATTQFDSPFVVRSLQAQAQNFMRFQRKDDQTSGFELLAESAQRDKDQLKDDERHLAMLEKQEQLETSLVKIHTSGDERAAVERTYQMRLDYAQKIYELEKKTVGDLAAGEKLEGRQQDAGIQAITAMAELQQKRFDAIQKTSAGLFHTLFTNPRGFGGQLAGTVRDAALHPIEQGLGTMTANLLFPLLHGSGGGINDVKLVGGAVPVHITNFGPSGGTSIFSTGGFSGGGGTVQQIFGDGGFSPIGGSSLSSSPLGMASSLGPGGTPGFFGGGSSGGGGFSFGGLGRTFQNLKNFQLGGLTRSIPRYSMDADGNMSLLKGSHITGLNGALGMGAMAGGSLLAQNGLLGSARGTGGGVLEGVLGGAMIGFAVGGPIGAGIGAAIGAGIGIGEAAAGVETPQRQAHRLIMDIYHVDIPERGGAINQIVAMAQQYGGSVSMAVRTPQARQLIELYAMSTGQKSDLFLMTPHNASLVQQGGTLNQGLSYFNGLGYNYQSQLPTLGNSAGMIPTFNPYGGGGNMSISLDGPATTALLSGEVARTANAGYVGSQSVVALQSGASRFATAAAVASPSTIFA